MNFDKVEAIGEDNANRVKRKVINDEMRDMVQMSKDTYGAIRQMNEAFNGETEFKYVAKVDRANKTQVEKVEVKKTPVITKSLGLDHDVDDSMALVPLDSTEHKK